MGVEQLRDGERVVFTRMDPTEHALLVCKIGAHHGTLKESQHLKPAGTEWATPADLRDAGFLPFGYAYEGWKFAITLAKSLKGQEKFAESLVARARQLLGDDAADAILSEAGVALAPTRGAPPEPEGCRAIVRSESTASE